MDNSILLTQDVGESMQSLKIKAEVKPDHTMTAHLPENIAVGEHEFILIYNETADTTKIVDLMQYNGTLDWPEDGLAYQQRVRSEWDND